MLLLSPFAFGGVRWMRSVSTVFGVFMLLNGLGHLFVSFYMGALMLVPVAAGRVDLPAEGHPQACYSSLLALHRVSFDESNA